MQPAESEITFSLNTKALKGHGVYVLKFYALAKLSTSTKPLASNVLTHKLAHYESDKNTPLLLVYLPENKEQYLPVSVDYCIVYPNSTRIYDFILSVNGRPEKTLSIEANTLKQYELYFEKEGRYTVSGVVEDLNLRYEEVFDVVKYSGNIPIINSQHADLMLYLDPRGKSNDEDERHLWKNKGKDVCSAQLSDMHYGTFDGWLTESDNTPYLKLKII